MASRLSVDCGDGDGGAVSSSGLNANKLTTTRASQLVDQIENLEIGDRRGDGDWKSTDFKSLLDSVIQAPGSLDKSTVGHEQKPRNFHCKQQYDLKEGTLHREPTMDEWLRDDFLEKALRLEYKKTLKFRQSLPAYAMKDEIIKTVNENQVVVICGETGCGKTTQVPQYILDDSLEKLRGSKTSIICTQPRRIATLSMARRVGDERCDPENSSRSVGYQIRFECVPPRDKGSITFCTPGILLKRLGSDKQLENFSHVILDEVHERELNTDILISILKQLIKIRPDLKVIVMSATLDPKKFSRYFDNCPMIEIQGHTYPVKEFYLEDIVELTGFRFVDQRIARAAKPSALRRNTVDSREKTRKEAVAKDEMRRYVNMLRTTMKFSERTLEYLMATDESAIDLDLIVSLLSHICIKKPPGAILVFLPGWKDISDLNGKLEDMTHRVFHPDRCLIIPLHSLMPSANQTEVFEPPPEGVRKIILATNIAETSITIADVVYVVDCGKVKLTNLDVGKKQTTLMTEWVSLANVKQRRGRAGRVQAGECFHLFTSFRLSTLDKFQVPEILRTRLDDVIIMMKFLGIGDISNYLSKGLDMPSAEAVAMSVEFLQHINALNELEELTALGHVLAQLPLDPQCGKMLIYAAIFSCFDPISTIASCISDKQPFYMPLKKEELVNEVKRKFAGDAKSDHILWSSAYKAWTKSVEEQKSKEFCAANFLSLNTLTLLRQVKEQLAGMVFDLGFLQSAEVDYYDSNVNSANKELISAIVCAGLYPNIAFVKQQSLMQKFPIIHTFGDGLVKIHPKSINFHVRNYESKWLVYHTKIRSSGVYLHDTTMVTPFALLLFGGKLNMVEDVGTDFEKQTVITIDKAVRLNFPEQLFLYVQSLRKDLENYLWLRIRSPELLAGPGRASSNVIEACVKMITQGHNVSM